YEKTLATIDAKFALEQANSAANSISKKMAEIDELKTEIKSAQSTLYKSNVGLTNAKKEYEDAVAKLNELKDGTYVSNITLDELLKQIEIAEAEVESAKANLETAKEARDEATKCAKTALVLMDKYKAANQPSIGGGATDESPREEPSLEAEVVTASLIAPAPEAVAPAAAQPATATHTSSKTKTDSKAQDKETTVIADEKTPLAAEKKADDKKDDVIEVISDEETPLAAEKNWTLLGAIIAGVAFVLAVISVIFVKRTRD
ncbi:MAG: hypothetical protein HUJ98_03520, partial [Bacteroidaceae bacterium]|nr:hypothetical protein [Bacteroidaceae bacterium]